MMKFLKSGARKSERQCLSMSDEEREWIENRIYELIEKIIETSEDKYAEELKELLDLVEWRE